MILGGNSRYVTGSQIFKDGTAENVIWLLNHAIHEYARPREILTDHCSQFWSVHRGESNFDAYCERNRIKHILGSIGKPTTPRKIERWFRTYDLEYARFPLHWKFIQYYNYDRPHNALGYSSVELSSSEASALHSKRPVWAFDLLNPETNRVPKEFPKTSATAMLVRVSDGRVISWL